MLDVQKWSLGNFQWAFVLSALLAITLSTGVVYIRACRNSPGAVTSILLKTISTGLAASGFLWCLTVAWLISWKMADGAFVPLLLPALLAAFGTRAAWRNRPIALLGTGAVFGVFSIVTGFSIGQGYLLAAAAFLWSGLVSLENQSDRSESPTD